MHIFIATPYALVHKPVTDKNIRLNHIPAVDNDRVFLSG